MDWSLTVLGSSSALPAYDRHLSAQLLHTSGHYFLFDCGEGTQFQLKKYRAGLSSIDSIFISHLHGDHVFGLFGLLSTYHMLQRTKALHVYAFGELEDVVLRVLRLSGTRLQFPMHFHSLHADAYRRIMEDEELEVYSLPLKHSVPVCGFVVKQKPGRRRISKAFVAEHTIATEWFPRLIAGEDYIDEQGRRYRNADITFIPTDTKSYAYCSDTAYHPDIVPFITGVDLLYHEATFAEHEEQDAIMKRHSTAAQAARIASQAAAKKLLIGHYSSRYAMPDVLRQEAERHFQPVVAAYDGLRLVF